MVFYLKKYMEGQDFTAVTRPNRTERIAAGIPGHTFTTGLQMAVKQSQFFY